MAPSRPKRLKPLLSWGRIVLFWQSEQSFRQQPKLLHRQELNPAPAFLRGLAFVYFFAFGSAFLQVDGLIGSQGILPAATFLERVAPHLGFKRFFLLPTIAWISSSDFFLQSYCLMGVALSLLFFWGRHPRAICFVLWFLYLSLVDIGGEFYGYQWDALLLEVGFLSIWLCPSTHLKYAHASKAMTWLFRLLLFRLLFSSGVVKWTSGDPLWQSWDALRVHYETQPLPTPIAWYVHQLPSLFHKACTYFLFVVEVVVPILFFLPSLFRQVALWLEISLQLAIALTGNYTFFNLLTAILCLFLLERPEPETEEEISRRPRPKIPWLPWARRFSLGIWTVGGLLQIVVLFRSDLPLGGSLLGGLERYFLINRYGLFAVMTPVRYELEIQGSSDGKNWKTYELPYKPGRLSEPPHFVAPYQPRLDWQLWFAALSQYEQTPWLNGLVRGLLQGREEVLSLFRRNPFPGAPPKYLRILKYEYHFSHYKDRRETGNWWSRYLLGPYTPVFSLESGITH